jgi:hypothetical protein
MQETNLYKFHKNLQGPARPALLQLQNKNFKLTKKGTISLPCKHVTNALKILGFKIQECEHATTK